MKITDSIDKGILESFFARNRKPIEGIRRTEFAVWDCLKACAVFNEDWGGVPKELVVPEALLLPLSDIQEELYTDLLDARANQRLPDVLAAFQEFVEDGE